MDKHRDPDYRRRLPWRWPMRLQYALALGVVFAAIAARWQFNDVLGPRAPFLMMFAVLLPLVQLVRPVPFFVAAAAGWVVTVYLFVPDQMSWRFDSTQSLMTSLLFAAIFLLGTLTAWMSHTAYTRHESDRHSLSRGEEAQAHLAAIVDSSDDAIISKLLDGTITSWNKSAERLFGYKASETIGRSVTMLLPPEQLAEEDEILSKLRNGQRIDHMDTIRKRKDGSLIDISLTVSPVRDASGKIIGASKTARDITERKHSEFMLKEADRRKDEFLATLAHELRNPLAAISLALHVLENAGDDPQRVSEMSALIQRQSSQLKRLIDDLMDVGRISRGKVVLERAPFDVVEVLREVLADNEATCTENGLSLSSELPQDKPIIVNADVVRFSQVINNLLHNATKFTDSGGRVTVKVSREGRDAVVRVSDTGIGMPASQLERIFDMFAQVEQEGPTLRAGGLGIGLSLARSIIELQGGTIKAYSAGLGEGSEFVVRLPAVDTKSAVSENAAQTVGQSIVADDGLGQRIVAADDNSDALHAVALMLRMKGHEVETAVDGLDALEKVRVSQPDIALLDIGMPGMDGYEVARSIRNEPWGQGMLLVAMTGWGQKRDKQQALEAGFDMHLTKPVDLQVLEQIISSAPRPVAAKDASLV